MARRLVAITLLGTFLIGVALHVEARWADDASGPEQARRADEFVDYLGVATHFGWKGTVYTEDSNLLHRKLRELGVRHIRDSAYLADVAADDRDEVGDVYDRYRVLTRDLGIRATLIVDPGSGSSAGTSGNPLDPITPYKIERIQALAGPSLEAFEGPNEHNKSDEGPNAGQNPDWASELETWQRQLWESVNDAAATAPSADVVDVPVVGPSIGKPYPDASEIPYLGDAMDYGNIHPYRIGHPGSNGLEAYDVPHAETVSGDGGLLRPEPPLMVTETGYHTTPNDTCRNTEVSEEAVGKYVPRMALEYFNYDEGRIVRSFLYQLVDHYPDTIGLDPPLDGDTQQTCGGYDWQRHFGLLKSDGTEKPAFRSLENLIDLLQEPDATHFRPDSLDFALDDPATATASDAPASVHHTLLQKSNGTFYLVLWNEVSSYRIPPAEVRDPATCEETPDVVPCETLPNQSPGRDLENPPVDVSLRFEQPFSGTAREYLTNESATAVRTSHRREIRYIDLEVPDEPLVVELAPDVAPDDA